MANGFLVNCRSSIPTRTIVSEQDLYVYSIATKLLSVDKQLFGLVLRLWVHSSLGFGNSGEDRLPGVSVS